MEEAEPNKLFVGGISWETTDDILKEHFAEYGVVLGSVIAVDRHTGKPRGFAFVTFSESSAVDRALQNPHIILSRTVEVKRAIPRNEQQNQQRGLIMNNTRSNNSSSETFRTKKIFVGGLSANLTDDEFRTYFGKFGRITDVVVMHDNMTHRPRGFGFITFDSEESVEEVMRKKFHELTGKLVEVKRAVPKDSAMGSGNSNNGRGHNINNSYNQGSYLPSVGYYPTTYGNVVNYSYGAGIYGGSGGYPFGGYGPIGYGSAPIAPRGPWPPAMVGFRGGFFPYSGGVAPMYPTFVNGAAHGPMGFGGNGYSGILKSGGELTHPQNGGGANMQM
ncbi:hypothetical protein ABFS82_05G090200 [Erythranthe guttata]|uniref:RRM domain-containing protein n=1 Tax=Erythranthe guttata TaxID=4155 RepID=A0A022RNR6_ERYGU|nr:PREDICTED: heterogeneous nuclear ribonucleoprotein 1-like [Erythranthe guttata]EYU40570.1 hypothetical protein MIMGU_mgv1a020862mg [Erythranthe guttata]|eukprot:XP_012833614.1 PREDICTED: heterogeneous nuclear ribonucleoprotein 1-like [Erythranthe guttata]